MAINTLIFDLDGTLVDNLPALADKAAELIQDYYKMDVTTARDRCIETHNLPFKDQLEILFPKHLYNKKVAKLYEQWKESYQIFYAKPRPETVLLLKHLKKHHLKIGVTSDNTQDIVSHICQHLPIDAALGYQADTFCKGEPHFQWFMDYFKTQKDNILFIGDSLNDAKIAKTCHIHFAGITHWYQAQAFNDVLPNSKTLTSLTELDNSEFYQSFT